MPRACLFVLFASLFLFGCTAAPEEPQVEFKAVSTTMDVMESLIAHMADEVWASVRIEIDETGTHEYQPETRDEWKEVAYAAKGLAEASTLLMYEGRVEDYGDWKTYVEELTARSLEAAKAAEDQDPDALLRIGSDIYETCTKCHEQYLEVVELRRTGGKPAE